MRVEVLTKTRNMKWARLAFAAIKNPRRRAILDDLCNYEGLTLKQITTSLKKRGYYHSQSTILEYYVDPLLRGRLIERTSSGMFCISSLGEKVQRELNRLEEFTDLFNSGKSYEEFFLIGLAIGQQRYSQLTKIVPIHTIARIEKRINPLIEKHASSTYYFLTDNGKNGNTPESTSNSSQDIFHLIKNGGAVGQGISATDLFEKTTLRPRTTYKHLKRLKEQGLIKSRKHTKSFGLTPAGKKVADTLYRITAHVFFEMEKKNVSSLIIEYLETQTQPVSQHELMELLDRHLNDRLGRVAELSELELLINELKLQHIIEGNRHSGYTLPPDPNHPKQDLLLPVESMSP